MRGLATIEKELAYAQRMAEHAVDSYDHQGRLFRTSGQLRATYRHAITRLEAERDSLLVVLQKEA